MEPNVETDLEFFIVGEQGKLRNPDLVQSLEALGLAQGGVNSRDYRAMPVETLSPLVDTVASKLAVGRRLAPGEVGCALSHRDHWDSALRRGNDWTLVLEDDAFLAPGFSEALQLRLTLPTNTPILIALFDSPVAGITTPILERPIRSGSTVGLYACGHNTNTTLGYLANRAALEILRSERGRLVCPADWPPAAGQVQFLLAYPYPLATLDGVAHSTIGKRISEVSDQYWIVRLWENYWSRYWRLRNKFPGYSSYFRWSYGSGRGFLKHMRSLGLLAPRSHQPPAEPITHPILSKPLAKALGVTRASKRVEVQDQ